MQVEHILPSVAVNPPGPTRDEIAASDILLALRHLPRNKNPWVSLQPKKTIVKGAHRGTFRRVKTVGVDTQAGTRRSGPLCERRDGPARDSPLKPPEVIRHAHRSSARRAVAPVVLGVEVHRVQLQRSQELAAPPLVLALPACRRCPSASTPRPCPSSRSPARPAARIPVPALALLARAPPTHRECARGARSRLRGQRRACLAARAPTACGGKA